MTETAAPDPAHATRLRLRADLMAAMKARRSDEVAVLRTTIAAIDNAEASVVVDDAGPASSEHVAGGQAGVGSTDIARHMLSADDVRAIIARQIDERVDEANNVEALGRPEAAAQLRNEAHLLRSYLSNDP